MQVEKINDDRVRPKVEQAIARLIRLTEKWRGAKRAGSILLSVRWRDGDFHEHRLACNGKRPDLQAKKGSSPELDIALAEFVEYCFEFFRERGYGLAEVAVVMVDGVIRESYASKDEQVRGILASQE